MKTFLQICVARKIAPICVPPKISIGFTFHKLEFFIWMVIEAYADNYLPRVFRVQFRCLIWSSSFVCFSRRQLWQMPKLEMTTDFYGQKSKFLEIFRETGSLLVTSWYVFGVMSVFRICSFLVLSNPTNCCQLF